MGDLKFLLMVVIGVWLSGWIVGMFLSFTVDGRTLNHIIDFLLFSLFLIVIKEIFYLRKERNDNNKKEDKK